MWVLLSIGQCSMFQCSKYFVKCFPNDSQTQYVKLDTLLFIVWQCHGFKFLNGLYLEMETLLKGKNPKNYFIPKNLSESNFDKLSS